jgi:hypothetical protein
VIGNMKNIEARAVAHDPSRVNREPVEQSRRRQRSLIRDARMIRGPNEARSDEFDLEAFCVFMGQVIAQHFGDQVHARPSFLDEIGNDGDPGFGLQLTICDAACI